MGFVSFWNVRSYPVSVYIMFNHGQIIFEADIGWELADLLLSLFLSCTTSRPYLLQKHLAVPGFWKNRLKRNIKGSEIEINDCLE